MNHIKASRLGAAALGIAAALICPQVFARGWPSAGGWDVAEAANACGMTQEYEGSGSTSLTVLIYLDGAVMLQVKNNEWSAVAHEKYELEFWLDDKFYSGTTIGVGNKSDGRGFIAKFDPSFTSDFSAANSFSIYRGDVLVDKLSLKGTAAAMSVVQRCIIVLRAEAAADEAERKRLAHIPTDPFASIAKPAAGGTAENAVPRGSVSSWITDADYPSRAQREERSGTTGFRLDIGTDGRVTNCTVTLSSGSPDLDAETCRLLPRRARFKPAIDAAGAPTTATVTDRYTWRLPM